MEAIALTILHRHPLSTPRAFAPRDIASALDHAETSASPTQGRKESKAKRSVPVIDLLTGPPDLDLPNVSEWVAAEHAAFDRKTIWDDRAELHVSEVAVSASLRCSIAALPR